MTMFRFLMAKQPAAAGYGLFAGGNFSGSAVATTEKYKFINAVLSNGTNLTTASQSSGVTSLAEYALFGGGHAGSSALSTMQKYTHSTDGLSSGTSLLVARAVAAANNSFTGVFGGGDTSATLGVNSKVTDKYLFSTASVSAGTDLGTARRNLSSCASSTIVYFGAGYVSSAVGVVDKYTISTDGVAPGTSLTARWGTAASSNSTDGYFFSGDPQFTLNQQYSFSNDSVSSKTSLSGGRLVPGAAGDGSLAIISAGLNSGFSAIKTSEKYIYSDNAMTSGTSLANAKHSLSAASSTPGNL